MLIEIFIDLVSYLAEFFGNKLAGSVDNDSKKRHSLSVIPFCIIVGILTAAVTAALGYAAYYLFGNVHPILGIAVGVLAFFIFVLFFSMIIVLIKKNKKK